MSRVPLAQRSQQFVEAAARVIAREGVSAATTRRIAAEADAPLASLHYCFRSKEELMEQVYKHLSEDYARALTPLSEDAGLEETVSGHLRRIWKRIVASPWEQITTFELLLRATRMQDEAEKNRNEQINSGMYGAWTRSTASIFGEGAARSGLHVSEERLTTVARIAIAGIDGITLQHISDSHEDTCEEVVEDLIQACIHLLDPNNLRHGSGLDSR
ncbi:TetR/AcrR family transcriptional regulator [Micrococcoides hystricis]|uniref:TetR/AcrR family transcriptional regulator n=1 Tax=Micrococcoides hystricis TaxID=1572761 RepID=A0ABV6PBK0_9MICC